MITITFAINAEGVHEEGVYEDYVKYFFGYINDCVERTQSIRLLGTRKSNFDNTLNEYMNNLITCEIDKKNSTSLNAYLKGIGQKSFPTMEEFIRIIENPEDRLAVLKHFGTKLNFMQNLCAICSELGDYECLKYAHAFP